MSHLEEHKLPATEHSPCPLQAWFARCKGSLKMFVSILFEWIVNSPLVPLFLTFIHSNWCMKLWTKDLHPHSKKGKNTVHHPKTNMRNIRVAPCNFAERLWCNEIHGWQWIQWTYQKHNRSPMHMHTMRHTHASHTCIWRCNTMEPNRINRWGFSPFSQWRRQASSIKHIASAPKPILYFFPFNFCCRWHDCECLAQERAVLCWT